MRWTLPALVLVCCGLLGGCGLSEQALQQLAAAHAAHLAGDMEGVIRETDAFLADNGRSGRAGEAFYFRGSARFSQAIANSGGDAERLDPALIVLARADLEQAVKSNTPDLRGRSALTLGQLAFDTNDIATADRMFRLAIEHVGQDPVMGPLALYRLGCALQRQGQWVDADLQFQKVMHQFPASGPSREAARRVNATAWTVQAGSFDSRDDAERAVATLKDEDDSLPVRWVAILEDGASRPRYVVQVGFFASHAEAAALRDRVQEYQGDVFVTVTK